MSRRTDFVLHQDEILHVPTGSRFIVDSLQMRDRVLSALRADGNFGGEAGEQARAILSSLPKPSRTRVISTRTETRVMDLYGSPAGVKESERNAGHYAGVTQVGDLETKVLHPKTITLSAEVWVEEGADLRAVEEEYCAELAGAVDSEHLGQVRAVQTELPDDLKDCLMFEPVSKMIDNAREVLNASDGHADSLYLICLGLANLIALHFGLFEKFGPMPVLEALKKEISSR